MSQKQHVIKLVEGERVYLRPPEKEDAGLIYQGFYNPVVRRFTGTNHLMSRDDIDGWLAHVAKDRSRCLLSIVTQEDDRVVGDVELMDIHPVNRSAGIRVALNDEKEFGKGYGTEGMRLMLDYGFGYLNLRRIDLEVFEYNHRAIRTYEKLGFKREGVKRKALFYENAYHDEILMGLLAEEYQTK